MATPIGTNALTAITRRYLLDEVTDNVYNSNTLFYRLNKSGKKIVRGGTQIEEPLQYAHMTSAGFYTGFDLWNTAPQDVLKNAAFDWKQAYVIVTVDGLTIAKNDSPESIASLVATYFEIAQAEMSDQLGGGVFSDAVTNVKSLDGIQGAIDNGTVAATYGGLGARTTTNSYWQPAAGALDTTTTTLTIAAMQTVFGAATQGARHPTIIVTTQANYNRLQALVQTVQRFPSEPMGQDEQLAKAGFTNLLYNNVPVTVDSHCNTVRAGVTGDSMYFINEDYLRLYVMAGKDMDLGDFRIPTNQDVYVAPLTWYGALAFSNIARQGALTAITA